MIIDEDFEHVHPLSNSMLKIVLREDITLNDGDNSRISVSLQPIRINISQCVISFILDIASAFENLSKRHVDDVSDELEEQEDDPTGPFFNEILFSPAVSISFDYDGVGISAFNEIKTKTLAGSLLNILLSFAQMRSAEIVLQRVHSRSGILGWPRLANFIIFIWLDDIKKYQLPNILKGIGPMHAISEVLDATLELAKGPIVGFHEGIQPGGGGSFRGVVSGMKRGVTRSTAKSTGAVLELLGGFLGVIHKTAEVSHDFLAPTDNFVFYDENGKILAADHQNSRPVTISQAEAGRAIAKATQPTDIRTGFTLAYKILADGSSETIHNVKRDVKRSVKQHGVVIGGVGAVWRNLPAATVLKPIILSAEAAAQLIGGARNSLQPHKKAENREKWRSPRPI